MSDKIKEDIVQTSIEGCSACGGYHPQATFIDGRWLCRVANRILYRGCTKHPELQPINDGGQAFARTADKYGDEGQPGMTLREYFAGQAGEWAKDWSDSLTTDECAKLAGERPTGFPELAHWSARIDAALRLMHADAQIAALAALEVGQS